MAEREFRQQKTPTNRKEKLVFSPSDVKLSNPNIMFLVSTISGQEQKRAADKLSAIGIFTKTLSGKVGEEVAKDFFPKILMSENLNVAHHLLGQLMEASDHIGYEAIDDLMTRLNNPEKPKPVDEPVTVIPATQTRGMEIPMPTNIDGETKTAAKAPAAAPVADSASDRRGRPSPYAGKKLISKAAEGVNPRREGTHGHKSHQIILEKPGIVTEDYFAAGGRSNDLNWDISHGHVVAK